MEFTGERFVPEIASGEIEIEHKQRYYSVLELIKDKVVLDAACGVGYGTSLMSDFAQFVYGIDISNESIKLAEEEYGTSNTKFIEASIEKIPLPSHSIDVVVSFETIEHVNEEIQVSFMNEIKRLLKPNGILIISTPDKLNYSDVPKFRNSFHIKEFYFNEFQLFLTKYFANVQMFNQGFETLSVLNHVDNNMKTNTKYKLIDPKDLTNINRKYIVAVCSETDIPHLDSFGNMMIFKENPNFTSKLLVDFGEGYHKDITVFADLIIKGNEFRVEFINLNQLQGVIRYKWIPLQDRIVKLNISNVFPKLSLTPLNAWSSREGYDEFHDYMPQYEIINTYGRVDRIIVTGDITILDENSIFQEMMYRVNTLESTLKEQRQLDRIESKFNNISDSVLSKLVNLETEKIELLESNEKIMLENKKLHENAESMLADFNNEVVSLRNLVNQTINERNNLFHERNHILSVNTELNETINSLIRSESWRITSPLRYTARNIKAFIAFIKKILKKIVKTTYHYFPVNKETKQKIKDMIYKKMSFLIKNTGMYKIWLESKRELTLQENKFGLLGDSTFGSVENFNEQPGKIAVHLHLYYVDLLDEFFEYFCNIPYDFDLYVSIQHEDKKIEVEKKLSSIQHLKKIMVKVTPNRGRDVAPMFVDFGEYLSEYNYVSHVHSKKSLYTGTQQDGWRKHLLDNLFGNQLVIKKLFSLFNSHKELGLIYPETYQSIPYWAHTWLSNKMIGSSLLSRMGIKHDFSQYIDFPAGTMFWAKVEALKPLFDLGLTYNDFDEENKQIDGTIAHAIERAIIPIVTSTGNGYAEINVLNDVCRFNKGSRNLMQYWPRKLNELKDIIDGIDIITFDIFDTLITRPLLSPDTVFKMIAKENESFFGNPIDYINMRKEAESEVRKSKNYIGDCSIDEIYEKMSQLYDLAPSLCEKLKYIEIDNEIKLCMPRKEVIEILNYSRIKNKRIILISDMYLDVKTIERMLAKCNINYYDELLVSSKLQKRKDNGQMWDYFKSNYEGRKTLHIGDNEHSDVQIPEDKGLLTYHVMNGANMFYNTDFGNYIGKEVLMNDNWGDSALIGPIVAKEFNSPFKLSNTNGVYQITSLNKLGYIIFGPILLHFVIWLIKKTKEDEIDNVLFLAREGFLLKKLFDKSYSNLKTSAKLNDISSIYFLTSRRAASVASLKNIEDIYYLLQTPFEGTISDLLKVRFGLILNNADLDKKINMPDDIENVKNLIEKYTEQILAIAEEERAVYLEYCKSYELDGKKNAIVDVGYSGSIQLYLSKLLNQSTSGYYFVTSNNSKGTAFSGNIMNGYFGENENYLTSKSAVYKYQLILESILTSDQGQFINFIKDMDGKLIPNFGVKGFAQQNFENLKEIMDGIEQYFEDVLKIQGDLILEMPTSKSVVEKLLDSIMIFDNLVSEEIKQLFLVEDTYCLSDEISVFTHYKRWFGL
ncbi:HAD-IA family hydrolase [Bacillus sp. FJAT-28004]|uniref:HAD-IA family hydrolase n=1 Tax=Bacillus sp. FJAT-28004 TaxID=1679165 RepID=UPI0006B4E596|nr:HAD-IA family hydrolase [Bacillus sp. FJAT-28004]